MIFRVKGKQGKFMKKIAIKTSVEKCFKKDKQRIFHLQPIWARKGPRGPSKTPS